MLARPLADSERLIARHAYDDFERYYSAHPEDARKFLDDGERKPDPALAAGGTCRADDAGEPVVESG